MNDGGANSVTSQANLGIDRRDVLGLIGLILLGVGLGLVWLPAGLFVPGAIMVGVAIFGVR